MNRSFTKAIEANPKPTDKERALVATIFANSDKILAANEPFLEGTFHTSMVFKTSIFFRIREEILSLVARY